MSGVSLLDSAFDRLRDDVTFRDDASQNLRLERDPGARVDQANSIVDVCHREVARPNRHLLTDNGGRNFLYMPITNYSDFSLSASEKLLGEKMAIMGLGDGGAHVGFILDAGFPTWLLTHWGKREKKFAMPELVRRLTSDTAGAAGLGDRGRISGGLYRARQGFASRAFPSRI